MQTKLNILFLISHEPDNRYRKRIELLSARYSVGIIYWNRFEKSQNFAMDGLWTREVMIPANRVHPFKRIPETLRYIRISYKEIRKLKPECIYVGNIDMLFIAACYKKYNPKAHIIYEIADLHGLIIDKQKNITKKIISFLLKKAEKSISKSIDCLILTSMKFYDIYYKEFVPEDEVIFMPNMPNEQTFKGFTKKRHSKFTVGFIGWIRYKEQLKMLINSANIANVNVLFAGGDRDDTEFGEYCKKFEHCTVLGAFDYLAQIQEMYQKVDCIYSVYDADMVNVRAALPNKLYEAILCELPIIVAKDTYLAELVLNMGIGEAVDHKNGKELTKVLKRLSSNHEYYESLCNNCRFQKKTVNLNYYNNKLLQKIEEIVGH